MSRDFFFLDSRSPSSYIDFSRHKARLVSRKGPMGTSTSPPGSQPKKQANRVGRRCVGWIYRVAFTEFSCAGTCLIYNIHDSPPSGVLLVCVLLLCTRTQLTTVPNTTHASEACTALHCCCVGKERSLRMDIPARRRADSQQHKGSQKGSQQQGSAQQQDRCMVTCRLQRNTFLPGEQVRGTIKFGVSSEDQESVDIQEVRGWVGGWVLCFHSKLWHSSSSRDGGSSSMILYSSGASSSSLNEYHQQRQR